MFVYDENTSNSVSAGPAGEQSWGARGYAPPDLRTQKSSMPPYLPPEVRFKSFHNSHNTNILPKDFFRSQNVNQLFQAYSVKLEWVDEFLVRPAGGRGDASQEEIQEEDEPSGD